MKRAAPSPHADAQIHSTKRVKSAPSPSPTSSHTTLSSRSPSPNTAEKYIEADVDAETNVAARVLTETMFEADALLRAFARARELNRTPSRGDTSGIICCMPALPPLSPATQARYREETDRAALMPLPDGESGDGKGEVASDDEEVASGGDYGMVEIKQEEGDSAEMGNVSGRDEASKNSERWSRIYGNNMSMCGCCCDVDEEDEDL